MSLSHEVIAIQKEKQEDLKQKISQYIKDNVGVGNNVKIMMKRGTVERQIFDLIDENERDVIKILKKEGLKVHKGLVSYEIFW